MKIKVAKFLIAIAAMLGWGYVLGAQGETYSPELAKRWGTAKQGGKDMHYFTVTAARWYGHKVADCSGTIILAIRTMIAGYDDQTADGLYAGCATKGTMDTISQAPAGACVHKKGHIGIYIGNGEVIECKGVAYGTVKTKLSSQPWTGWGLLAAVDYSEPVVQKTPAADTSRNYVVTANGVNFRSSPKILATNIISKFRKGEKVYLDSYDTKTKPKFAGVIHEEVHGYVAFEYIRKEV